MKKDREDLVEGVSFVLDYLSSEPIANLVKPIYNNIVEEALKRGLERPQFVVEGAENKLAYQYHYAFVNVFTHLMTNSLDHGFLGIRERGDLPISSERSRNDSSYLPRQRGGDRLSQA